MGKEARLYEPPRAFSDGAVMTMEMVKRFGVELPRYKVVTQNPMFGHSVHVFDRKESRYIYTIPYQINNSASQYRAKIRAEEWLRSLLNKKNAFLTFRRIRHSDGCGLYTKGRMFNGYYHADKGEVIEAYETSGDTFEVSHKIADLEIVTNL